MLKDKKETSVASPKKSETKVPYIDLQEIKGFEDSTSEAFVCDINTGICGPVKQEKEGK